MLRGDERANYDDWQANLDPREEKRVFRTPVIQGHIDAVLAPPSLPQGSTSLPPAAIAPQSSGITPARSFANSKPRTAPQTQRGTRLFGHQRRLLAQRPEIGDRRDGLHGADLGHCRDRIAHLCGPYPAKNASAIAAPLPLLVRAAGSFLWNVTAQGAADIPSNKAVIFCANRQSVIDPLWILYSLSREIRKKTFIVGGRDLMPPSNT